MVVSMTRRQLMTLGAQAVAVTAANRFFAVDAQTQIRRSRYEDLFVKLDRFAEQYMREMNSPGMTLVLADREGVQRVVVYGFSDRERRLAVKTDDLFQIGSISKSFVAICLLQLHDEGRLDLNKPITEYLPWFRIESSFAPITTHHLLTHSSGLPGDSEVFPSDPAQKHRAS